MYGMNFDQFSEGGVTGAPIEQFNPWAQSLAMANRQQMQQPMGKPGLLSPMPSLAMPGLAGMTPPAGVPVKPAMNELVAYSQSLGGDNDYVSQAALASRLFGQGGFGMGGSIGGTSNPGAPAMQKPGPGQSAMAMRAAQDVSPTGNPVSSNMPDAAQAMMNLFGQGGGRQGGANQFRKPLQQRGGPFNFLGGFQF